MQYGSRTNMYNTDYHVSADPLPTKDKSTVGEMTGLQGVYSWWGHSDKKMTKHRCQVHIILALNF